MTSLGSGGSSVLMGSYWVRSCALFARWQFFFIIISIIIINIMIIISIFRSVSVFCLGHALVRTVLCWVRHFFQACGLFFVWRFSILFFHCRPCRHVNHHRFHHHTAQILQVSPGRFSLQMSVQLLQLTFSAMVKLFVPVVLQVQIYELEEHKLETWRGWHQDSRHLWFLAMW